MPLDEQQEEEAFQYFMKTGKYLYKGVEYPKAPHKASLNLPQGTLFVKSLLTGQLWLSVYRIPDHVMWMLVSGAGPAVMNLPDVVARGDAVATTGTLKGIDERTPVFLELETAEEGTGNVGLMNEQAKWLYVFKGVPNEMMKDLWLGVPTDITVGVTGREKRQRKT